MMAYLMVKGLTHLQKVTSMSVSSVADHIFKSTFLARTYRFLTEMLVLLFACYFFVATEAKASDPQKIELGVLVTSLHDLNSDKGNFSAELWVWTKAKTNLNFELARVEITSFDNKHPKYFDIDTKTPISNERVHTARKLGATFLHNYDLKNFPFDRQVLKIHLEHTQEYADTWAFITDPQSGIDKSLMVEGWKIDSLKTRVSKKSYDSNFGLTELNPSFSRVTVEIDMKREAVLTFFKLTLGLVVAVVIAMLASLLPPDNDDLFSSRVGLLGATLLAVVVSQQFADTKAGDTTAVTLIDSLHMLGSLAILALFVCTLVSRFACLNDNYSRYSRIFDRSAIFLISIIFFMFFAVWTFMAAGS
jgi:hypothetical protein